MDVCGLLRSLDSLTFRRFWVGDDNVSEMASDESN
jgi:hypothetical protein